MDSSQQMDEGGARQAIQAPEPRKEERGQRGKAGSAKLQGSQRERLVAWVESSVRVERFGHRSCNGALRKCKEGQQKGTVPVPVLRSRLILRDLQSLLVKR